MGPLPSPAPPSTRRRLALRGLPTLLLPLALSLGACRSPGVTTSPTAAAATKEASRTDLGGPELVELVAGAEHVCARRGSGEILCWGSNASGQLGRPGIRESPTPQAVARVARATKVVAGDAHTCALITDGSVLCWGNNSNGELGDGRGRPGMMSATPVAVRGLHDAIAIAAGSAHTCALRSSGGALCWGDNRSAQVGNDARAVWIAPVAVDGLQGAVAITAGRAHTCAIGQDGQARQARCWGEGSKGQLGDGGRTRRAAPQAVSGLGQVKQVVAAGDRTCALRPQGDVVCWGEGSRATPTGIPGIRGATTLALSPQHACARLGNGRALCWGSNREGELGDGSTSDRGTPVAVASPQPLRELALGHSFSCAITQAQPTGGVVCWGSARGAIFSEPLPRPIKDEGERRAIRGVERALAVSAGDGFTCALLEGGTAACWGRNDRGQLGVGSASAGGAIPVLVRGLADAAELVTGTSHACARRRSGQVVCWGAGEAGQIGDGGAADRPGAVAVAGLGDAVALAAGGEHTCARRGNGAVVCWGQGERGQLGQGKAEGSPRPAKAQVPGGVVEIDAGSAHTCARVASGAVYCWGSNNRGQIGDGTSAAGLAIPQTRPVPVRKVDNASALAIGGEHSCAIRADSTVACWGAGDRGTLGAGTGNDWTTRVPVKGLRGALALAAGAHHTVALTAGGVIFGWGDNQSGAIGEAPRGIHKVPVVGQRLAEAQTIAAGADHTCARTRDGRIHCWGGNASGQLGEAEVLRVLQPLVIPIP